MGKIKGGEIKKDIIKQAKDKGYKIAVSKKGFTRQGYKYRITKDKKSLMYGNTLDDIAYLIGLTNICPKH